MREMTGLAEKKLRERRGTTLVELIVTFALIGIFMVAATFMVSASLRLFSRMQSTSNAVTVSDLILDKISGEIAAAKIPEKDKEGYYFWLEKQEDASWVAFCSRSESPVSIYADEDGTLSNGHPDMTGQLYIKYYEMTKTKEVHEINWHFDKRAYMGYVITNLTFTQPEPVTHPNVILIKMTLKNERTGFTYDSFRYAENYNFDSRTTYMCARNDGETGVPTEAKQFEIKQKQEPEPGPIDPTDPEEIEYIVRYIKKSDGYVFLEETKRAEAGTTIWLEAIEVEGYTPILSSQEVTVQKDSENLFIFEYVPDDVGDYEYNIRGHVNAADQSNYFVEGGGYSGTGFRSNWALFQEKRKGELGKLAMAPFWPGYTPVNSMYEITSANPINIPYVPNDVEVTIYAMHGDTILDTVVLIGKYESYIDITKYKQIAGYASPQGSTRIPVFQISGVEYIIPYALAGDAPFRPVGSMWNITAEGYPVYETERRLAEQINSFFLDKWTWKILQTDTGNIGYRVFQIGGKDCVLADFCDLNGNNSINQYKAEIAAAAGSWIDKNNVISLNDVKKGGSSGDIVWRYLVEQMSGSTQQEKDQIVQARDKEMIFKKVIVGGEVYSYLESVSYTRASSPIAKVIITFYDN